MRTELHGRIFRDNKAKWILVPQSRIRCKTCVMCAMTGEAYSKNAQSSLREKNLPLTLYILPNVIEVRHTYAVLLCPVFRFTQRWHFSGIVSDVKKKLYPNWTPGNKSNVNEWVHGTGYFSWMEWGGIIKINEASCVLPETVAFLYRSAVWYTVEELKYLFILILYAVK